MKHLLSLMVALAAGLPALAAETSLGDLDLGKISVGWGKPQKDHSIDGKPLTVGGQGFAKGIGVHADGYAVLGLDGQASRFRCQLGIDDETQGKGDAFVVVYGDQFRELARSPVVKGGGGIQALDVDIAGQKQVIIEFNGNGGIEYDHLDLIDPVVVHEGKVALLKMPALENKPYLQTPPAPPSPRLNPPYVFGVRPGSPVLFRIPTSGVRPIAFSTTGLPPGLALDPQTGILSGTIADPTPKTYPIRVVARNAQGEDVRTFRIVVGDRIALTPPMGWNSWYVWSESVNQKNWVEAAELFDQTGLADYGWSYVNLDDCWQGERGGADLALQANEKFPDIQAAVARIHALGLKAGLYSTPWIGSYAGFRGGSCANADGTYEGLPPEKRLQPGQVFGRYPGHNAFKAARTGAHWFFDADMKQIAAWGFDFIKVDWNPNDIPTTERISKAVRSQNRDILLSLSNAATFASGRDYARLAELWRTTGDIQDQWGSISGIGFAQPQWAGFAGPGHWNDPDMLQVGFTNTPNQLVTQSRPTRLTPDEQYSQVSMWALHAAPLILSCDLTKLDPFTLNLITNAEVIAVDQDPLGKAAVELPASSGCRILRKELENGDIAIGIFNTHAFLPKTVSFPLEQLRLPGNMAYRNLWTQQPMRLQDGKVTATIPPHGCLLFKAIPVDDPGQSRP